MTTDPFPKEAAVEVATPSGSFRVGGIAKGSGMIEPLMATMLAVVTTDAGVDPSLLQRALAAVADVTFNAITVDGECSTNDCVFALANGASGVTITDGEFDLLVEALRGVCEPLAIGIVRGGEGATKLVTVEVTGGRNAGEAKQAARAIANSPLVKTALFGKDPNWGRIAQAAGMALAGEDLEEIGADSIDAAELGEDRAEAELGLRLDRGEHSAHVFFSDLGYEYIRINAEYTT
jgi:glutamate N-acetyltransferase/amino-acid N-acetyltransferase